MGPDGVSKRLIDLPQFIVPLGLISEGLGKSVTVTGPEARHMIGPKRLSKGKMVRLADGTGHVVAAKITGIASRQVNLEIIADLGEVNDLIPATFFVSMVKAERFEFAIAKLSEIGIELIVPVITERSLYAHVTPKRLRSKLERWRLISLQALKQSRGFKATGIVEPMSLKDALDSWCPEGNRFVLWEQKGGKGFLGGLYQAEVAFPVGLLIGPEGGFTRYEIEMVSGFGFKSIGLGKRILRSETAAIYAASCIGEFYLAKGPSNGQ